MKVSEVLRVYEKKLAFDGRMNSKVASRLKKIEKLFGHADTSELNDTMARNTIMLHGCWNRGTVRRDMNMLNAALNVAAKDGLCKYTPLTLPRPNGARTEHMDVDEIRRFLVWININKPELLRHFLLLIDAGLRINEAQRLTRANIGEDTLMVTANEGKSIARRIPLSARLKLAMRSMASGVQPFDNPYHGGHWKSAGVTLGRVLKTWCRLEKRKVELRLHDLRHTFAYQCAVHGCDIADLQGLMGHSSIQMTMVYRGFVDARGRKAIAKFS